MFKNIHGCEYEYSSEIRFDSQTGYTLAQIKREVMGFLHRFLKLLVCTRLLFQKGVSLILPVTSWTLDLT